MIEAQVLIHPHRENAQEGDVLLVALSGHPWGTFDTKHLLVVKWEDAELEARLQDMATRGPWPVISYPYKTKERFSSKQIDLRKHPRRHLILDRETHVPVLQLDEYKLRTPSVWERVVAWWRK